MTVFDSSGRVVVDAGELPPPLQSRDEVRAYILEQVERCLQSRHACDVPVPRKGETMARAQDRCYRVFLTRHGAALGALGLALRTNQVTQEFYAEQSARVRDTLLPTMVGAKEA